MLSPGFLRKVLRVRRLFDETDYRAECDKLRADFQVLEEKADRLQQGYDGYRAAFEALNEDATEWRQGRDGYRAAFEALTTEAARTRDARDRVLRTLGRIGLETRSLPPGLAGKQLGFLHIGKTAGTSMQHALFEALKEAAIFHGSLPEFDEVTKEELMLNDLVIGHFTYQHVQKMRPARFLMTFLRDPVDRLISNYHFLRTSSPLSAYSERALKAARCMSLNEFLLCDDPGVRMVTENFQSKALAYDFRPDHLPPEVNGKLLEVAERNLQLFDFVGIVEYFDESVCALSDMLGVALKPKKLNVNPDRPAVPATVDELERAKSLNRLDIELYDNARQRFLARVNRDVPSQS